MQWNSSAIFPREWLIRVRRAQTWLSSAMTCANPDSGLSCVVLSSNASTTCRTTRWLYLAPLDSPSDPIVSGELPSHDWLSLALHSHRHWPYEELLKERSRRRLISHEPARLWEPSRLHLEDTNMIKQDTTRHCTKQS